MPDKRTPCGKECVRCWQNRLRHGNKTAKQFIAKNSLTGFMHGFEIKCRQAASGKQHKRIKRMMKYYGSMGFKLNDVD